MSATARMRAAAERGEKIVATTRLCVDDEVVYLPRNPHDPRPWALKGWGMDTVHRFSGTEVEAEEA